MLGIILLTIGLTMLVTVAITIVVYHLTCKEKGT